MFNINLTPVDFQVDSKNQLEAKPHFLQTKFWANFKSLHGWKNLYFKGTSYLGDFYVSVLLRNFVKKFTLAYIPLGVTFSTFTQEGFHYDSVEYVNFLVEFKEELKNHIPKNTFCLRIDPPIDFYSLEAKNDFLNLVKQIQREITPALTDIQPPDTVILNLLKSEDELLSSMKSKWRYNVRLAEKKGVTIEKCGAEAIEDFYKIFTETATRDGIAVHGKNYYKSLLELSSENTEKAEVSLFVAKHEGDVLAGIITLFTETEAVYLYGASSNLKRNLMATYLLQWEAIKQAKAFGSKQYDFYGIPPENDENHPMYGLYRFKTGFGGDECIIHRIGSLDAPLKKGIYNCYSLAEKLRAFYYKKVKKLFIKKKGK